MKKLKYLLMLAAIPFSITAHAGIIEDIFGPGKAAPLDIKSCPLSIAIGIDNVEIDNLKNIKPTVASYALANQDKSKKVCEYQSSDGVAGLLYVMGTKKFPQTAFATSIDVDQKLGVNILVDSYSVNGLTLKGGQQVVTVWADDEDQHPVQIGSARITIK